MEVIRPETIALVRERIDIVEIVRESVPSLKKRGRSFVGLCPFHKEKSPSFHVNPERGFFHCFGCKEGGSALDFVMKVDGMSFPEAVRMLAERAGIPIEEETRAPNEADRQKKRVDDLYAVNHAAAQFYEAELRTSSTRSFAIKELEKRGLVPGFISDQEFSDIDDAIQAFRLGYAPPGWDGLCEHLKAQGFSLKTAEEAGLVVARSQGTGFYDRFRHRLMFAVVDTQGRVVAFSGRALDPIEAPSEDKPQEKMAKYINSPETPIYTKGKLLFGLFQGRHSIRDAENAIVVEGNFDVVSLYARGIRNVVAPLGTAFTVEQARLLRRYTSNVTLLFDGDAAGKKATKLSREPLRSVGLFAKVATLPDGIDPDDLVRSKGPAAVTALIERAPGIVEHLLELLLDETFNLANAQEQATRLREVTTLLSSEEDTLLRETWKAMVDRLAGRLDLVRSGQGAFRALEESVKKSLHFVQRKEEPLERANVRSTPKPRGAVQRAAISLAAVEYHELLDDESVSHAFALLEGPSALLVAAIRRSRTESGVDCDQLRALVPVEIRPFVERRLAAPEIETLAAAREIVLDNAVSLERLHLEDDTKDLAKQSAKLNDFDKELELAQEASNRIRKRHLGDPPR